MVFIITYMIAELDSLINEQKVTSIISHGWRRTVKKP